MEAFQRLASLRRVQLKLVTMLSWPMACQGRMHRPSLTQTCRIRSRSYQGRGKVVTRTLKGFWKLAATR